ncbi:N-acetylneuraminate synthase [Candidatus Magnetaquicoccus inordinatus]|uniref:N-acetylneuraminate synthase n=1 Tax=Candidatus Magnetaquicoccus inordinatus TaxID=2496818 RepID=UPI00102AAA19|nr:N-acetylneuraminate synthase [Candidatus Magnetaquicoccus inordinatus]
MSLYWPPPSLPAPAARTLIIAEAGVNHNGNLQQALQLVDAAVAAGADAVKFQTFRSSALVGPKVAKAAYQQRNTGQEESQWQMLQRLELDAESHIQLQQYCFARNIHFISTPFDRESLQFLVDGLYLQTIKIASGEITNAPLLWQAAHSGRRIILSTGMSTLAEVEQALAVLACGYLGQSPSLAAFAAAWQSAVGRQHLAEKVILLHCTSDYPAPAHSINLRAMDTLRAAFALPVGLSDHSEGIAVATAAVARGACLIEKHFTLDRTLPGPDHRASLEPNELTAMVQAIRAVEQALGTGGKNVTEAELPNRTLVRKQLVAVRDIAAGELFTTENLGCKRPGVGIAPMHYWHWLGRRAKRSYQAEEAIVAEDEEAAS